MNEHHPNNPTTDFASATGADTRQRSCSVLMAGGLTAMSAPGGGEVQMLSLQRELVADGVQARLWRPWEDQLAQADCVHLFGSLPEHLGVARAARRQGVPVVLSPITWFDLAGYWRGSKHLVGRCVAASRFLLRAAVPKIPSWRRSLYQSVDLLMPNSNAEASQLIRYFGVRPERIHVTPNGADPRFADADPTPFIKRFGRSNFVLCVGRIEPRKNQLGLLSALRNTGIPVVILGDPVPGHEDYLAACHRVADANVWFLDRMEHDDPMLGSAYAACGCLALTSWFETPGLVALEAAMSGTPLVLPRGGCAREYFDDEAEYVRPGAARAIREAVSRALVRSRSADLASRVRQSFSWNAAARVTRDGYEKVLSLSDRQ